MSMGSGRGSSQTSPPPHSEILRRESIDSFFGRSSEPRTHQSQARPGHYGIERLECPPERAVYIGDHVVDGQAAAPQGAVHRRLDRDDYR